MIDLTVKRTNLAALKPYDRSLKKNDHAVQAVAEAISRFGFRVPILAQADGTIIDGHLRYKAARSLGLKEAPVITVDGMSAEDLRAFRLSLYKTAELAEWDIDLLTLELQELSNLEIDLDGLGFNEKELESLLADLEETPSEPPAQISRAKELGEKWGTAPGQLWRIGPHRLLIGDSTKEKNWERLTRGRAAVCVFTDPPYGVSYQSQSGKHERIANDELTGDNLLLFLTAVFVQLRRSTINRAAWYVWHAGCTRDEFRLALNAAGIVELQNIIWVKPSHVFGRSDYHWAHEPCIYGVAAGYKPEWYGGRAENTVWRVAAAAEDHFAIAVGPGVKIFDGKGNTLFLSEQVPDGKKYRATRLGGDKPLYVCRASDRSDLWEVSREAMPDHPTQKPPELARRALENSTLEGEIVLDAFLGSGSTLVAAEQTGRICYGMELSPDYAGVILERAADMGLKPELRKE